MMAALTVISPDLNGEVVTPASAAGGGDTFAAAAGGVYYLHVRNGHSSSQSVVVNDPTTAAIVEATTAADPDLTVAVANATEKIIRIHADRYRDPSTGLVSLTYSGVTALTVNVYRAG